jgi:uncharacterized membrane protein
MREARPADSVDMTGVVQRNIRALMDHRERQRRARTRGQRWADRITEFAGSLSSAYVHLALFGAWLVMNLVPGLPHFDPSLVALATLASCEAIFLTTFVLMSQNRMQADADERADLDLQIGLLAEHEVTRLIQLVSRIAERMDIPEARSPELAELSRDVDPQRVLDEMENGSPRDK